MDSPITTPVQQVSMSTHFIQGVLKIAGILVLNYIKFTQITPVIMMYCVAIMILLVPIQTIMGPEFLRIPYMVIFVAQGWDFNKPQSMDENDIIPLYLAISSIPFLIYSIANIIFKFRLDIPLKKRFYALIITPVVVLGLFFILLVISSFFPSSNQGNDEWLGLFFITILFIIVTIALGLYALIVSYILDFFIGVIKGDEEKLRVYISILKWLDRHQRKPVSEQAI